MKSLLAGAPVHRDLRDELLAIPTNEDPVEITLAARALLDVALQVDQNKDPGQ